MGTQRTALSLALIWLPFAWLGTRLWFVCDDAFISFRYAQNLAQGNGLRFNPGDGPATEGFSNLLWVLISAIPESFGTPAPTVMPILSALCGMTLLGVFYRAARTHWTQSPTTAYHSSTSICQQGTTS